MNSRPTVDEAARDRVLTALAGGRWIKARELSARFGIPSRLIRAVAEETGDVISGQRGYKLARHATPKEIEAAIADLESRVLHLSARANRHRRYLVPDRKDMPL